MVCMNWWTLELCQQIGEDTLHGFEKKIGCGLSEADQAHIHITVVENIY